MANERDVIINCVPYRMSIPPEGGIIIFSDNSGFYGFDRKLVFTKEKGLLMNVEIVGHSTERAPVCHIIKCAEIARRYLGEDCMPLPKL